MSRSPESCRTTSPGFPPGLTPDFPNGAFGEPPTGDMVQIAPTPPGDPFSDFNAMTLEYGAPNAAPNDPLAGIEALMPDKHSSSGAAVVSQRGGGGTPAPERPRAQGRAPSQPAAAPPPGGARSSSTNPSSHRNGDSHAHSNMAPHGYHYPPAHSTPFGRFPSPTGGAMVPYGHAYPAGPPPHAAPPFAHASHPGAPFGPPQQPPPPGYIDHHAYQQFLYWQQFQAHNQYPATAAPHQLMPFASLKQESPTTLASARAVSTSRSSVSAEPAAEHPAAEAPAVPPARTSSQASHASGTRPQASATPAPQQHAPPSPPLLTAPQTPFAAPAPAPQPQLERTARLVDAPVPPSSAFSLPPSRKMDATPKPPVRFMETPRPAQALLAVPPRVSRQLPIVFPEPNPHPTSLGVEPPPSATTSSAERGQAVNTPPDILAPASANAAPFPPAPSHAAAPPSAIAEVEHSPNDDGDDSPDEDPSTKSTPGRWSTNKRERVHKVLDNVSTQLVELVAETNVSWRKVFELLRTRNKFIRTNQWNLFESWASQRPSEFSVKFGDRTIKIAYDDLKREGSLDKFIDYLKQLEFRKIEEMTILERRRLIEEFKADIIDFMKRRGAPLGVDMLFLLTANRLSIDGLYGDQVCGLFETANAVGFLDKACGLDGNAVEHFRASSVAEKQRKAARKSADDADEDADSVNAPLVPCCTESPAASIQSDTAPPKKKSRKSGGRATSTNPQQMSAKGASATTTASGSKEKPQASATNSKKSASSKARTKPSTSGSGNLESATTYIASVRNKCAYTPKIEKDDKGRFFLLDPTTEDLVEGVNAHDMKADAIKTIGACFRAIIAGAGLETVDNIDGAAYMRLAEWCVEHRVCFDDFPPFARLPLQTESKNWPKGWHNLSAPELRMVLRALGDGTIRLRKIHEDVKVFNIFLTSPCGPHPKKIIPEEWHGRRRSINSKKEYKGPTMKGLREPMRKSATPAPANVAPAIEVESEDDESMHVDEHDADEDGGDEEDEATVEGVVNAGDGEQDDEEDEEEPFIHRPKSRSRKGREPVVSTENEEEPAQTVKTPQKRTSSRVAAGSVKSYAEPKSSPSRVGTPKSTAASTKRKRDDDDAHSDPKKRRSPRKADTPASAAGAKKSKMLPPPVPDKRAAVRGGKAAATQGSSARPPASVASTSSTSSRVAPATAAVAEIDLLGFLLPDNDVLEPWMTPAYLQAIMNADAPTRFQISQMETLAALYATDPPAVLVSWLKFAKSQK